jgi:hypothetical protein
MNGLPTATVQWRGREGLVEEIRVTVPQDDRHDQAATTSKMVFNDDWKVGIGKQVFVAGQP